LSTSDGETSTKDVEHKLPGEHLQHA
jgi:hypothetical protein